MVIHLGDIPSRNPCPEYSVEIVVMFGLCNQIKSMFNYGHIFFAEIARWPVSVKISLRYVISNWVGTTIDVVGTV